MIIKNPQKLTSSLFSNLISFYEYYHEKLKSPGTSYHFPFRLSNMLISFLSLVSRLLGNFDILIQRGVWVIPKITIDNLCKPVHDIKFHFQLWTHTLKQICSFQQVCVTFLLLPGIKGLKRWARRKIQKFVFLDNESIL